MSSLKYLSKLSFASLLLISCSNSGTDSNPDDLNSSESKNQESNLSSNEANQNPSEGKLSSSEDATQNSSNSNPSTPESSSSENSGVSVPESSSSGDPVLSSETSALPLKELPVNQFCIDNPSKCGTVEVHGRMLQTVAIGTQTWFAENYKAENCTGDCLVYGSYLTFYDIARGGSSSDTPSKIGGVCPIDYNVPSPGDYEILLKYIAEQEGVDDYKKVGHFLRNDAEGVWDYNGGLNKYGFNAIPSGEIEMEVLKSSGDLFAAWTSAEVDGLNSSAHFVSLSTAFFAQNGSGIGINNEEVKIPLRCVKHKVD